MHIWNGADQIILMYAVSSMKRWASTDIRLTISPTVDFFRAALLSFRDCNIYDVGKSERVSEQILNSTSAQLGYTVLFTLVFTGKYRTEDKIKTDITKIKHNTEKANYTKHSKTKLAWLSRLLRQSARKRGGLILQCSRADTSHVGKVEWIHSNTEINWPTTALSNYISIINVLPTLNLRWFIQCIVV